MMCQTCLGALCAKSFDVFYVPYCPTCTKFWRTPLTIPVKRFGLLYVAYVLKILVYPTCSTCRGYQKFSMPYVPFVPIFLRAPRVLRAKNFGVRYVPY